MPSLGERGGRRFSQAISEGDGISVVVEVETPDAAHAAESDGAEALVVSGHTAGVREATELPILWRGGGGVDVGVGEGLGVEPGVDVGRGVEPEVGVGCAVGVDVDPALGVTPGVGVWFATGVGCTSATPDTTRSATCLWQVLLQQIFTT